MKWFAVICALIVARALVLGFAFITLIRTATAERVPFLHSRGGCIIGGAFFNELLLVSGLIIAVNRLLACCLGAGGKALLASI